MIQVLRRAFMLPNPAVVGFRKGPTARLASVGCIARPSLIQELNPRTPTLRLHPSRPRANQPILAQAISGSSSGDDGSAGQQPSGAGPIAGLNPNILDKQKFRRLLKAKVSYIKVFFRSQKVSVVFQYMLFVASLMFVGLYVTVSRPCSWSCVTAPLAYWSVNPWICLLTSALPVNIHPRSPRQSSLENGARAVLLLRCRVYLPLDNLPPHLGL